MTKTDTVYPMVDDNNGYDALSVPQQTVFAGITEDELLQAHIAATSENVNTLIALARNLHLCPNVQPVLASNEYGLAQLDREDQLSSAHAQLLARSDLAYYPARLVMEENTPAVRAMILANAANPVVRQAAAVSNVREHRTLI